MTEIKPFSLNFQPESNIFVIDEFSQHKTALLNEYCYSHSPVVINDINQLISQKVNLHRKLVLDCVLKWDNLWQYNYVADTLMCHQGGLLMFMSKPVAFDKMIRSKVDYLILFRGRNIRYMRKVYKQYLTSFITDPMELINKFKTLTWGQGLVLDLAGMAHTGKFEGNYYYYDSHAEEDKQESQTEFSNLDSTISNWVAEFKEATTTSSANWELITGPEHEPSSENEIVTEPEIKETSPDVQIESKPDTTEPTAAAPTQGWFSYLFGWTSFNNNNTSK